MSADQRWRRAERELAVAPEDAAGWLRLSHVQERSGDLLAAGTSAVRAAAFAYDPGVIARARALGWEGFWPSAAGLGGTRQSPLPGPHEGVMRWRQNLPRLVQGTPLVGYESQAAAVGASAGLVLRAPNGELSELSDWDASRAPVLFRGAPAGVDPARLSFARGKVWSAAVSAGRI